MFSLSPRICRGHEARPTVWPMLAYAMKKVERTETKEAEHKDSQHKPMSRKSMFPSGCHEVVVFRENRQRSVVGSPRINKTGIRKPA